MTTIINLTQHSATPEQVSEGVVDLLPEARQVLARLLTFDELPSGIEIANRAHRLVDLVRQEMVNRFGGPQDYWDRGEPIFVMIGGAPYLMSTLERSLSYAGFSPVYAFSLRVSEEQVQADGSVRKVNVFRHAGWIRV